MTKFPKVKVKLTGTDGNVFALAGKVTEAMRKAKVPADDIATFRRELMQCGSYNEALQLMIRTVSVS